MKTYVFNVVPCSDASEGSRKAVSFNDGIRNLLVTENRDYLDLEITSSDSFKIFKKIEIVVQLFKSCKDTIIDENTLLDEILKFLLIYPFKEGHIFYIKINENVYALTIHNVETDTLTSDSFGFASNNTVLEFFSGKKFEDIFHRDCFSTVQLKRKNCNGSLKWESNYKDLGIGGLDSQLDELYRRALSTRSINPKKLTSLGLNHCKGILLHGPPGTGKTLIARKIANILQSKSVRIINGPEVLSKYVGEGEKNIRKLFEEARKDQELNKENSGLHVLIFDEFDALCRRRGMLASDSTANDNIVNQLLCMIDGVDPLNNILLIGLTNRKDLIDEAILRSGRFEIHLEIPLPDKKGRLDILDIKTKKLKEEKMLGSDFDSQMIVDLTQNYSGADIEGLVKSAFSFANITDFSKSNSFEPKPISMMHFQKALSDIRPRFAKDSEKLNQAIGKRFIFLEKDEEIQKQIMKSVERIQKSEESMIHSILLEGDCGTGKTALSAKIALETKFDYIKFVSSRDLLGLAEDYKANYLLNLFDDGYSTKTACIIIDELERIVEYMSANGQFSVKILQTLLVLLKHIKVNKNNTKFLLIGTTNCTETIQKLGLASSFNSIFKVEPIKNENDINRILSLFKFEEKYKNEMINKIKEEKIGIKTLLRILDETSLSEVHL